MKNGFNSRDAQLLICRRLMEEDGGSELVEAALCLPLLLLLSLGLVQLLLFLACFVGATYGSRAAARYASTHGASSQIPCTAATLTGIVNSYAIGIPGSSVQTTPTWSPSNAVGSTVTVQVSLNYTTGIPISGMGTITTATTSTGTVIQ